MICIKDDSFYKMKVQVSDLKELSGEGWTKGYWDVDVTKEVLNIFKEEFDGKTIQK